MAVGLYSILAVQVYFIPHAAWPLIHLIRTKRPHMRDLFPPLHQAKPKIAEMGHELAHSMGADELAYSMRAAVRGIREVTHLSIGELLALGRLDDASEKLNSEVHKRHTCPQAGIKISRIHVSLRVL